MAYIQPDGYLAVPANSNGRGVLVLHAWWGLNDTVKHFCTQLAEFGFTCFAPDLYHGRITQNITDAETLSRSLFADLAHPRADLAEAVAFLAERTDQNAQGLAVIGFSLGAFFALDLSVTHPDLVRSVVVFYGTRPGDYVDAQADYLGHFAEVDEFEPQEDVESLEESLKLAGLSVTFHYYEDTSHWFFEPDRKQAYNPTAAGLAWDRTLTFLEYSA